VYSVGCQAYREVLDGDKEVAWRDEARYVHALRIHQPRYLLSLECVCEREREIERKERARERASKKKKESE
jgi:hypothetical protein